MADYLTNSYDVSNDATKRFTTSTLNTASNMSIATMSFWLKRRSALTRQTVMQSGDGSTNSGYLDLRSDDGGTKFTAGGYSVTTFGATAETTEDALNEWVHYVMHWDTTTADGYSSRIYRNGVFLEGTYGNPAVDTKCALIRSDGSLVNVLGGDYNFDGWLADLHIVDGLTVPVTDFAEEQDGVWSAKEYTGSHGNNGAWFDGTLDAKDSVKVWSPNSLTASDLSTDIPPLYSSAFESDDLLVVSRDSVNYKVTRAELDAYLKPSVPSLPPMDVPLGLYFGGQNKWMEQRSPLPSGVNKKTFTISLWFRRNDLSKTMIMYMVEPSSKVTFNTSNVLTWYDAGTASTLVPNLVFDNKTEWYHFVMAMDTTQAIETDRLKMYINGNQITDFTTETYPALNSNSSYWSSSSMVNNFGGKDNVTTHLVAYMSEIIYVEGQALLPSDLGTTDESGKWVPAEYTGEYGSNGFYLNGGLSGTSILDASGNGRSWLNKITSGFWVVSTPITPTSGT